MAQHAITTPITRLMSSAAVMRLLSQWCRTAAARRRQRYFLDQLDEHGLRDIGLTRGDVMREVTKPFWRV